MFKNKTKLFAIIFIIIALVSSISLATDGESATVTSNAGDTTVTSNVDNTTTTENTTENTTDTTGTTTPTLYEDDLYLGGQELTVDQLVDGNAYIFGTTVTVTGKVGGDLFIIGETVNLEDGSYIYGNLFVVANKLNINGIVCDLYAACNEITIGETGVLLRDSRIACSKLAINGKFGRNIHASLNELSISETAHIYGDLNYSASKAVEVPSGVVDGEIKYTESSTKITAEKTIQAILLSIAMDLVSALVCTLVIFGLMLLIAPNFLNKVKELKAVDTLKSLGLGLAGIIAIPILMIILLLTVVGVSVGIRLAIIFALLMSITFAVTSISVSRMLSNKLKFFAIGKGVVGVIITTIVLFLLKLIPFVGGFIGFIISLIGLGILILSIFKREKTEVVNTTTEE